MSRLAAPLINKDEIFTPLRVNVEKARAMFSSNQYVSQPLLAHPYSPTATHNPL